MMTLEKLRQTGRTTRMLEHALRLSQEGRDVYVLADNQRDVNRFRILLGQVVEENVQVQTPESLLNFNWETMRASGMHPQSVVLVDHAAIERRFSRIVHVLHAYDSEIRPIKT